LEITETLGDNGRFMRHLVQYPSEGLMIHGFMNVPNGDGPFPVVIALHGYIDPGIYNTFDYTTRYADALANAGYLVIHPNLRGYKPSDDGDNLFRVGMAEDVLNLIAMVKGQGGAAGPLEKADPARIGLWGHSMGGGIGTRVMTVSPDVKAAVLYGAMSGDERKNYEAILGWTGGERGQEELSAPDEVLARISPEIFFDGISAAVSIHHGRSDATVPLEWSEHTCEVLAALGKTVECTYYGGAPHTFGGEADAEFMQNVVDFFGRYLTR
jgi:dienelactone hydrolase